VIYGAKSTAGRTPVAIIRISVGTYFPYNTTEEGLLSLEIIY